MIFPREIWKDVVGYENLYQVSSVGRVRSLNYRNTGETRILKLIKNKQGYSQVSLCKEGKMKTHKVHRLVAEAFIPNPYNKPQIDHINTIKTDNYYKNLRWCTPTENSHNELSKQHHSKAMKGENNPLYGKHHSEEARRKMSEAKKGKNNNHKSRQVEIFKNGLSLGIFPSVREIERQSEKIFEVKLSSRHISAVCRGERKQHKGFTFRYLNE